MPDTQIDEIAKLEAEYAENPEGRVFVHLAEAYRQAGDLERAYEVLLEGVDRHPDYPSAQIVLARVLLDMGEADEAERAWRTVLTLDPENAVALRGLGDLARGSGRRNEALNFYQQLAALGEGGEELDGLILELQHNDAAPAEREPKRGRARQPEPRAPRRLEEGAAKAPAGAAAEPVNTDAVALTELLVRLLEHQNNTFQAESSLTRLLATAVGRELELDEAHLRALGLASVLSNLGGLFQEDSQPAGGDAEQRRGQEQRRVAISLQLLQEIVLPAGVHEAIRHQHERWDGTGYPGGLQAEEIPFSARILAVAQACAARLVHRPGRPMLGIAAAVDDIQRRAGSQFDPVIVSVLRRVFSRRELHQVGYGLGGRVMIVHPEELRALTLASKLHANGYITEMVADVAALRDRLRHVQPQAYVLAADLPDGDTARLVREFRAQQSSALVPIVVLDANSTELRVGMLAAGADVSFARDVSFAEFKATLDALLRRAEIVAAPAEAFALANDPDA